MADLSDDEVYDSLEYQQYRLILDGHAAFFYAREELLALREREQAMQAQTPATLPTFQEWYDRYLQSPEWRARADEAKARAGGRCQLCNMEGPLQAHHRTYERAGHELPDDLIALCSDCHSAYHRWRRGEI